MKRILVIDDERTFNFPNHLSYTEDGSSIEVTYFRELPNVSILDENWDEVWLDNDLGYEGGEVRWLIDKVEENYYLIGNEYPNIKRWVIHTQNPVARDRMFQSLSYMFDDVRVVYDLHPFIK